ncbi:Uncharacterized protein YuzB, UPF0349 family [Thermoactinomyces sp. DSM 45891]|uniref:YuzB family protein n=1 Tax=Thermoactinomyces sp. DSM 45891 TaxID=1761907 RepID=UPI00091C748E|nr:YuzB family protein [Thermoactinomyces sp. DSM 45891]SFX42520.1 Uncharacterized protein YuzB, UPF0349 family [Thermoactinomyces sp. DSM 45891]
MRPLIEFCVNNVTPELAEVKKKLETNLDYDVLDYGCLGYCGICATQPYALVNGDMIKADTAEELLIAIHKAIDEMEIRF